MTILRNPGLRPYLDDGVQRAYSYDFVESYGDNWWCADWDTFYGPQQQDFAGPAAFLSPAARTEGSEEVASLLGQRSAEEYLGSQVIEYARANPNDPDIPEALYLTLRMIRYGCNHGWVAYHAEKAQTDQIASIAREAGAILRHRYAANPWTKKAAPFVWLGDKQTE
jgi:hypothetical protein